MPRVLDGALLLDAEGRVLQVTPNAVSCLARLGIRHDVKGKVLAQEVTDVIGEGSFIEESMAVVVMGRASWRVEIAARASTISMRALPLQNGRKRLGAVILLRDVSEVRRHEQELMTKDATIREIHHRVKNNLQTVSALLRLQSRRSDEAAVKVALAEAERRVQAIATVHAALSQNVDESVDFDEVARTIVRMAGAIASTDHGVEVITTGTFGTISADQAQALATVLNELVANSVEHGLADRDGRIEVCAQRDNLSMTVTVADDGVGFVPGTPMSGLGTQIVHQMVRGELRILRGFPAFVVGGCGQQPARRARAARRLRERRSSSLMPPHTPESWLLSMAHCRQMPLTSHSRHTALASATWLIAGPVFPMGKKSSGSTVRHAALLRQSMSVLLALPCVVGILFFRLPVSASWGARARCLDK